MSDALAGAGTLLAVGLAPFLIFAGMMQLLSNAFRNNLGETMGIKAFVWLTAPGVILHELGHALFCVIFRHKIVEMRLFSPKKENGEYTLGYVIHTYNKTSLYQKIGNFFIGTGPIWLGSFAIYILSEKLFCFSAGTSDFEQNFSTIAGTVLSAGFWTRAGTYLLLYLIFAVSAHITLSAPDLKSAKEGGVFLILFVFVVHLLFAWIGNWSEFLVRFLKKALVQTLPVLIFELLLFAALLLMAKIVAKIFR